MNLRLARLDDVCEINPRMPTVLADDESVSFLPMAGVSENGCIAFEEQRQVREVRKGYTYFERGDVLVAKITPCFENGKAARTTSLNNPIGFGSTEFHVLRAGRELDTSYLFHLIWNSKLREAGAKNMTGSAGQKRVPADFLKRLEIPLPPLNEQRRIATILDKADALRRKRSRAIGSLDHFSRSVYLDMFAGPRNRQKVTRKPIGSIGEVSSGSTPSRNDEANFGGKIHWVKTTEVRGEVINDTEEKVTEQGAKSARLKLYPKGTVLVAMYGQGVTRGKVAILGISATVNQACAAIVPSSEIHPVFLFHQLRQKYDELRSLGRGGNQPNLNGELVKNFEIDVPPRDKQDQFVKRMEAISDLANCMRLSFEMLGDSFASLQGRAFSGQL